MIDYNQFGLKSNFNQSIQHFNTVRQVVSEKRNAAEVVLSLLDRGATAPLQIPAILYSVLVEKRGYAVKSINLSKNLKISSDIPTIFEHWPHIDIVAIYYSPLGNINIFNPANREHLEYLDPLEKGELLVVYYKTMLKEEVERVGEDILNILQGINTEEYLLKAKMEEKEKRKQKQHLEEEEKIIKTSSVSQEKKARLQRSATVGVVVTNELFHNGNVEAWKKIIESYTYTYPENLVNVYYHGKKVTNLNTLFEWGKVKSGTSLMFNVDGSKIMDIIKLKKYLYQGASPHFEVFLKGAPQQVLKLF